MLWMWRELGWAWIGCVCLLAGIGCLGVDSFGGTGQKGAAAAAADDDDFDPTSLLEAKDCLKELPSNWEEKVVAEQKWSDKKASTLAASMAMAVLVT